MNRFESSTKPSSEREGDLRRLSQFHTVPLGVAGHDLHQPVQVIQSTDEWLSSMLDADADKVRQQLGEPAVARLSEQLDRLAAPPDDPNWSAFGTAYLRLPFLQRGRYKMKFTSTRHETASLWRAA
jgi:hypothetical protein